MGYYCYVNEMELKCSKDISKELGDDEFYLRWIQLSEDGRLDLDDSRSFKWSPYFERDLLFLWEMGVRGEIEIVDDFAAYSNYRFKDHAIEVYDGLVVYSDSYDRKIQKDDTLIC